MPQFEKLVDRIPEVPLPHLPHELRQIIHDQTVLVREELWSHLRDFPAGYVRMKAVEKGRVDHRVREGSEQVARLHERVHWLVDVTDKDHGSVCSDRISAT